MKKIILIFISILIIFNGCIRNRTIRGNAKHSIGVPYKNFLIAEQYDNYNDFINKWRDNKINKDYYLPNGNLVHVYPEAPDCIVHWEFDKNTKLLVGYKFEGKGCY